MEICASSCAESADDEDFKKNFVRKIILKNNKNVNGLILGRIREEMN